MHTLIPGLVIIAVDFDGTLCENKWPEIGEANEFLITYLKAIERVIPTKFILWTNRTGLLLDNAVTWCKTMHNLEFDAVNENLPEVLELFDHRDSRKISADVYVDDKATRFFKLPYLSGKDPFEDILMDAFYCEQEQRNEMKIINAHTGRLASDLWKEIL